MARSKKDKTAPKARTFDAAGTVTVACRLPCGLHVPVEGHGILQFKGSNDRTAMLDEHGHGLTSGVPAAAWDALTAQYATAKWLTSGAVFAHTKVADARAQATEQADENVGFDGIDPEAPGNKLSPAGATEPTE